MIARRNWDQHPPMISAHLQCRRDVWEEAERQEEARLRQSRPVSDKPQLVPEPLGPQRRPGAGRSVGNTRRAEIDRQIIRDNKSEIEKFVRMKIPLYRIAREFQISYRVLLRLAHEMGWME